MEQWELHEAMRQSLIGPGSPLWSSEPTTALILAGSMPSGVAHVAALRHQLRLKCFGDGPLANDCMRLEFKQPVVSHTLSPDTVDARTLHIGNGECAWTTSPWSRPFDRSFDAAEAGRLYIASRADCAVWLARLCNKVLICDCKQNARQHCWGEELVNAYGEWFGEGRGLDTRGSSSFTFPQPFPLRLRFWPR
jgi:hypothetical protein